MRRLIVERQAREFEPAFSHEDLVNHPNHGIYVKIMIDCVPSRPFSATTLHPGELKKQEMSYTAAGQFVNQSGKDAASQSISSTANDGR